MSLRDERTRQGYEVIGGAWIHERARLGDGVDVGPGSVIGPGVEIGEGCRIGPHAVIWGPTVMGRENEVHAGAVIGGAPQDLGYRGEPTRLVIGDRNIFREGVTVNRGAPKAEGLTRVGNDNLFMAMSHVGHDTVVEDRCVFANSVLLAGHCHVGSDCNLSGNVSVVQFVTIGRFSFVGGLCGVRKDLEPFMMHDRAISSLAAHALSVNVVGLRRAGMPPETIRRLQAAHRLFFRDYIGVGAPDLPERLERAGALCPEVEELVAFLRRKEEGRYGRYLERKRRR